MISWYWALYVVVNGWTWFTQNFPERLQITQLVIQTWSLFETRQLDVQMFVVSLRSLGEKNQTIDCWCAKKIWNPCIWKLVCIATIYLNGNSVELQFWLWIRLYCLLFKKILLAVFYMFTIKKQCSYTLNTLQHSCHTAPSQLIPDLKLKEWATNSWTCRHNHDEEHVSSSNGVAHLGFVLTVGQHRRKTWIHGSYTFWPMDFQDFSMTLNQVSMTKLKFQSEQCKKWCVLRAYTGIYFEHLSLKNILIISNSA